MIRGWGCMNLGKPWVMTASLLFSRVMLPSLLLSGERSILSPRANKMGCIGAERGEGYKQDRRNGFSWFYPVSKDFMMFNLYEVHCGFICFWNKIYVMDQNFVILSDV